MASAAGRTRGAPRPKVNGTGSAARAANDVPSTEFMSDPADHAYAHACAVFGAGEAAIETAILASKRGGRSRSAVLGHARHFALTRGSEATTADLDEVVPDELTELALLLAATRPVIERVIADLDGRHGLDRGGFARALGLTPAAAGARTTALSAEWQAQLDPVVLAHLGPGGCEGLAAVLSSPMESGGANDDDTHAATPVTLGALIAIGPAVVDHAAECSDCADRLRSMVSVRTLLGQRPIESAPAPVRAAVTSSRLRRPIPPPPLVPETVTRRWLRPMVTVAVVVAVAVGAGAISAARRTEPATPTVAALTEVPAEGSALAVSPSVVEGPLAPPVALSNNSGHEVRWEADADVDWLQVAPSEGRLEAGETATLRLAVGADAPEGEVRGAVRITGAEGSVTLIRLTTTVERPPDVAATADGCAVTVTVEDEGQIRTVELHEGAATTPLPPTSDGYAGRLRNSPTPMFWSVTAVDARGNKTRTPDRLLAPNACP